MYTIDMVKDRITIWVIFSGALIGFSILHVLYTLISRFFRQKKMDKELYEIKHNDIQKIIEESLSSDTDENSTKEEIDELLKSIYFDLYKNQKNDKKIQATYSDIEKSMDHVLDNYILSIIDEKDKLLQEKDKIILMLEERNEKFTDDIINKISYVMQEKDKLLREKDKLLKEKDRIILALYKKPITVPLQREIKKAPINTEPVYHYRENFINVND